jgi:hypothetical protein
MSCMLWETPYLSLSASILDTSKKFNTSYCLVNPLFMRADWKVHVVAAVHRCYAEGGSDCYAKL